MSLPPAKSTYKQAGNCCFVSDLAAQGGLRTTVNTPETLVTEADPDEDHLFKGHPFSNGGPGGWRDLHVLCRAPQWDRLCPQRRSSMLPSRSSALAIPSFSFGPDRI